MVHAATALAVPDKTTLPSAVCIPACAYVCISVCIPVCQAHTGLVGGVCVLWGRLDALDQGDDGTDALDEHERPLMPATRDSRDAQATRDAQGSCKRARKLVLVGHSTAGMHGRLYCHRYPEEVSMSVACLLPPLPRRGVHVCCHPIPDQVKQILSPLTRSRSSAGARVVWSCLLCERLFLCERRQAMPVHRGSRTTRAD
jgi:hypothetical protein